jgi:hypothetical protein
MQVLSAAIVSEYREVFERPAFGISAEDGVEI